MSHGETHSGQRRNTRLEKVWVAAVAAGLLAASIASGGIGTTVLDFFIPGSQPNSLPVRLASSSGCQSCHANYGQGDAEPHTGWSHTMMGQAARDPIFYACLAVANQDASFAGELCLRCHTPQGWLGGRSSDPSGGAITGTDFQGVGCSVCHRMVNPTYVPGQSPSVDQSILAALPFPPTNPHSGSFVMDPQDRRRGPYALSTNPHQWLQSPFHRSSAMCATCHDVSNPIYSRQSDDSYLLGTLNSRDLAGDKFTQFPVERTYSEWANSLFAQGPVDLQGRFGGNNPLVSTCQDCHMPKTQGYGANPTNGAELRADLPQHLFNGANTWVLRAVNALYPASETGMTPAGIYASIARAQGMLAAASDLQLFSDGATLTTRVINMTGHKLPTGYSEGRRIWVNVRFFDTAGALLAERGHYDAASATLTETDTKVYRGDSGVDEVIAAQTGLAPGPGFHFALNNKWFFDNRIPPMGFTNAGFASVQASPVGYAYADGQYWDDTAFVIPPGSARAQVQVYHQLTSKEYIEFLRDQNTTNDAGLLAYNQWAQWGKSPPTLMDEKSIDILPPCYADFNSDGNFDAGDIDALIDVIAGGATQVQGDPDINRDGNVDQADIDLAIDIIVGGNCPF